MPLKVLFIITAADTGGAQKYVRDLAIHLDPRHFDAKILYGGKDLKWLSNKVYPWFFFLNDIIAIFEMVRVFKRERPAVIHLNSSKTGVLGALAVGIYKTLLRLNPSSEGGSSFGGKPYTLYPRIIFTAHGWVFNPTNDLSKFARGCYVVLHRFAAHFTDTIICVSEYDRQLAVRYHIAPTHKLITIHNGIDPHIPFLEKEKARAEILRRLEIGNWKLEIARPWVGSLGRLVKEKNYATLVEAARLLPDAYFFVIGDGYEKEMLQLLITNYQLQHRFFLVPSGKNDVLLLKAFDIFTLPSIKEGLPYTLLEAMSAKLPVVVTNIGGMPEAITHEKNGLLIPPQDQEKLKEALIRYETNAPLSQTLGHAGNKTVHARFSLHQMVKETEKKYLSFFIQRDA